MRAISADLKILRNGDKFEVERSVTLEGDLTADQRARFADIVERTPVTLALKSGMAIRTNFQV